MWIGLDGADYLTPPGHRRPIPEDSPHSTKINKALRKLVQILRRLVIHEISLGPGSLEKK